MAQELKAPVGRPKLPETVIKELKEHIADLEAQARNNEDPYNELLKLAEIIRVVQRAVKGLGADDDVFLGLINPKDIRERTRLDEPALISHSAMRVVAAEWPEFGLFKTIAEMEDPYYISMDGEGRKEGILLQQAKSKNGDANNLVLNMPNTNGGPAENPTTTPPKKKGFLSKIPFIGR